MSKTAFIFPGQGAQYCGMGRDFYEKYQVAREVYELAEKSAGLDVAALCFQENDRLDITEYTQIAMLTTELAILRVLEQKGLKADCCAGLSLGEYGALAAARVMEMEDLFRLIRSRGIYMQEAYPVGGAMTAVLGLDADTIRTVCESTEGIVSIANADRDHRGGKRGADRRGEIAGGGCQTLCAPESQRSLSLRAAGGRGGEAGRAAGGCDSA